MREPNAGRDGLAAGTGVVSAFHAARNTRIVPIVSKNPATPWMNHTVRLLGDSLSESWTEAGPSFAFYSLLSLGLQDV